MVVCFTAQLLLPDCSCMSNSEHHLFFALPLKMKRLLKRWVHVIRRTNLPLNHHTRTCSQHLVNAEGKHLCCDEVPLLTLPSNNQSSFNYCRERPIKYRSASLGDEPVLPLTSLRGLCWNTNFPFTPKAES